jgi:serine/threonine-protein kinase
MPPEQARGEPVDARADIYAAGVILYELLTGTVPFDGDSPTEILSRMLTRAPAAPSRIVPEISPELDVVVLSALAKTPAKRPQSAADFMTALAPFGTSGKPSLPAHSDSEAPLPLVTERPSVPQSSRGQTLELQLDSTPPEIHPLLKRKA